MKPTQVKRYRVPAYPTKLEILSNPEVLEKNVPPAWRRGAEVAGAVTVFLAATSAFSGCDTSDLFNTEAPAIVAPIFEHGDGVGAIGCIVISPPLFLSEEEALYVIQEELSHQNLDLSDRDVELPRVIIKTRTYDYSGSENEIKVIKESNPLVADLSDPNRKVMVEFVSGSDYYELGGPMSSSSVLNLDLRRVAVSVAERVEKKEKGIYFGTFYDPMLNANREQLPRYDATGEYAELKAARDRLLEERRIEAKRLLRLQVRDFADWLKAQGVI